MHPGPGSALASHLKTPSPRPMAAGRNPVASPAAARRRLALELRRLREQADKSGDEVAKALYWSPSSVSRYEWAKRVPVRGALDKLLGYYHVTGPRRDYLLRLAQAARASGWWRAYAADIPDHQREVIGLEHAAADICIWAADMVPALLQNEAYARQVTSSYRHIEPIPPRQARRRVAATLQRQQILTREHPPQVTVVLAEGILQCSADDTQGIQQQAHQLVELADQHPALRVQVLPLTCPRPVYTSSFTILGFGDDLPDMVALEHLTSGYLVDDEREAFLYQLAFGRLAAAALDPAASRAFLRKLARQEPSRPG
jgi:transcriptional regulator with XRE-family HTH domain